MACSHPATGPGVDERVGHVFQNNLLYSDETYAKPLLSVWQPRDLCDRVKTQQLKQLDNNAYVRASDGSNPLILWSPTENEDCRTPLNALSDLQKLHSNFSANSRELAGYRGPLFRSHELGNFQVLPKFPATKAGGQLPAEVKKLLGTSYEKGGFVGAYPPQK